MKGLNIRKLAAIAVGGALVGSALAPLAAAIDVTKADVIGANGQPVVNVVAGARAAASDIVWAGNIATKVAQLATVDASLTGGEGTATPTDLSVDLTVGGATSYSTEYAKTYDGSSYDFNNASNSPEFLKTASSGQLPFLTNTTKSYRFGGTSYSVSVKESVGIKTDVKFVTQKDIKDIVAYMENVGDFNYVLSYGDGIPCRSSSDNSIKFTDGDNDHIIVPFLGEEFTVQECDAISSTSVIKLIKESAKANYNEGDTIPNLVGRGTYAGEELSVKLAAVTQTGSTQIYQARFDLADSEGNIIDSQTVSSGTYLNENFLDTEGAYCLETVVYVSLITVEPTTSKGVITMLVGKNVVTLAGGKQYPYDSTNTDTTTYYWTATFDMNTAATTVGVETVKKITVRNNVMAWNSTQPLWSANSSLTTAGEEAAAAGGDVAHFMQKEPGKLGYDFVKIKFDGFKVDQDTTQIIIGDNTITYWDSDSEKRSIPFYFKLGDNPPQATAIEQTITLDAAHASANFFAKCYKATSGNYVEINVFDNNKLNGAKVDFETQLSGSDSYTSMIATDNGAIAIDDMNLPREVDLNGVQFRVIADLNGTVNGDNNGATLGADGNCTYARETFPSVGSVSTTILSVDGSATISQIGTQAPTALDTYSVYFDDTNSRRSPGDAAIYFTNPDIGIDDTYRYRQYYSSYDGYVYLLLDSSTTFTNDYSSADVNFVGTDFKEDGDYGVFAGAGGYGSGKVGYHPYYWPDTKTFGNDPTDSYYMVGIFGVQATTTAQDTFRIHIDTSTDDLLQFPKSPEVSNYTADVNYFSIDDQPTWVLTARTDTEDALYGGVIDFGSTAKLTDDLTTATFTIPESQIYLSLSILGEGAVQTVAGGETVEGALVNETVRIAGKDITVSAINYTEGTCTVEGTTYNKIVPVGQLVYTDSPAPAGNHIIVGGYLVNRLAENVVLGDGSTLQEALTAPGDMVAETLSNGNIVVAGYTASDTVTAAKELIDVLDALEMA